MSLAAYLAKNYLNSSTPSSDPSDLSSRPKKRRKKDKSTSESSTLIIADDDDLSLRNTSTTQDPDEDRPVYDQSHHSADFRKAKKNNWQSLQPSTKTPPDSDAAEADRILASAATDQAAHHASLDDEDAPAVVREEDDANADPPTTSGGVRAGLQTAADTRRLAAAEAAKQDAERKALKRANQKPTDAAPEEETVYRDATGRRIDVSMKRAEARAAEQAKRQAEQRAKEDAMGEVQRAAKAQRAEDLAEARFLTVARTADDEEMNDELKGRLRWDDPMAAYMMQKQAEEAPAAAARTNKVSAGPRRKEYQGAAPPNRYGIRPGWRWDGVDRGNGFEKEWFQARGKQSRTRDLEYQWQMDE